MSRHKLTVTQLNSASLEPGKYGDGDGLWLHVKPSRSKNPGAPHNKSWVFIWIRNGRRHEMGFGAFGNVAGKLSLKEARARADEARDILKHGGDPRKEMAYRKAAVPQRSFGDCLIAVHETLLPTFKNPKHAIQWRTSVETYAKPLLKMPIGEVDTDHIVSVLKPIWREKGETANRVRGRIEKTLDYATALKLRFGDNPARLKGHLDHLLGKRTDKVEHFAAMPYAAVPALVERLRINDSMAAKALELTILCATRTNETIGAEWSDVDFENATWTIPAIKMKAEREHVIPLTADAVQVFRFMADRQLSNWVFPGRDPRKPVSNMTMLKLLKTLEPDFTVHGFRSAFRDWAGNETSQPRDIIEMSLAHVFGDKTELAYRRDTALNKRRKLMEAWAAYLNPAVDGVVKLHG
ncbi:tyrosine-type recombinase/integrase [Ahrensia marina]|uniref:Tyr recombinase domain-containing protein n=1 Tax=Ahrensia marina TaxID=1514904 RepID=A0A0M9GN58_9HYPH|nr:site-specific integrase [Ahrensia marina]KPB01376.1 hypothetical protein SU32_09005 [Ahrensia marina]